MLLVSRFTASYWNESLPIPVMFPPASYWYVPLFHSRVVIVSGFSRSIRRPDVTPGELTFTSGSSASPAPRLDGSMITARIRAASSSVTIPWCVAATPSSTPAASVAGASLSVTSYATRRPSPGPGFGATAGMAKAAVAAATVNSNTTRLRTCPRIAISG